MSRLFFVQSKSALLGPRGGRGEGCLSWGVFTFYPGGGISAKARGAPTAKAASDQKKSPRQFSLQKIAHATFTK